MKFKFWNTKPRGMFDHSIKQQEQVVVKEEPQQIIMSEEHIAKIDQQIHEEIHSVEDILIKEAQDIIDIPFKYDEKKVETLNKLFELGFCNVEQAKELKQELLNKERAKMRKDTIEYYKLNYPLCKYLDEDGVNRICKKYDLIVSSVANYEGEIPDKNQKEIVDFKIKRKDIRKITFGMSGMSSFDLFIYSHLKTREIISEEQQEQKVSGEYLHIIAPKHMFNTQGMTMDGNYMFLKDPVVLQPVTNGWLIVSAWGVEATHPDVLNENQN